MHISISNNTEILFDEVNINREKEGIIYGNNFNN